VMLDVVELDRMNGRVRHVTNRPQDNQHF